MLFCKEMEKIDRTSITRGHFSKIKQLSEIENDAPSFEVLLILLVVKSTLSHAESIYDRVNFSFGVKGRTFVPGSG